MTDTKMESMEPLENTAATVREPDPAPPKDEALAERATGGDTEAFEALCRRYLPELNRRALGMTQDHDQASEVVQLTLIRLHKGLPTYDPSRAFKPWLITILTNTLRSLWAQSKRVIAMDEGLEGLQPVSGAPGAWDFDPVQTLEAAEEARSKDRMLEALSSCVEDLDEKNHALYRLVFEDRLNHRDAAEVLQISHDSCRQRSVRLRRALRMCVEGKLATQGLPEGREGSRSR